MAGLPVMNINALAKRALEYCVECWNNKGASWQASHPDKYKSYKGQCVGVLRRSWRSAGVVISGMDNCSNPSKYMALLRGPEGSKYYQECKYQDIVNKPQYGDVLLFHGGTTVGHGVIYAPCGTYGDGWVSDAVQGSNWNCYRSKTGSQAAHDICGFRYRGQISYNGSTGVPIPLPGYSGGGSAPGYGGGAPANLQTRRIYVSAEEAKRGGGGGATGAYNVKQPVGSQGSWPSKLDMRALLEFLHAFPYQKAAQSMKLTKRATQGGDQCTSQGLAQNSGYLCSTFSRLAILYGFGCFTWSQACSWKTTKDAYNTVPKIGWCSLGTNGGCHGMNYSPSKNYGTGDSASNSLQSAAKSGSVPPGTMFHCTHHGNRGHVFIWGGDQFISDYVQGMKVIGSPSAINELTAWLPSSSVTIVNQPSGNDYSALMGESGGRNYMQDENGNWYYEETGYYDENGNWIVWTGDGGGMGGPVWKPENITYENIVAKCPDDVMLKSTWVRYILKANFHCQTFVDVVEYNPNGGGSNYDGLGGGVDGAYMPPAEGGGLPPGEYPFKGWVYYEHRKNKTVPYKLDQHKRPIINFDDLDRLMRATTSEIQSPPRIQYPAADVLKNRGASPHYNPGSCGGDCGTGSYKSVVDGVAAMMKTLKGYKLTGKPIAAIDNKYQGYYNPNNQDQQNHVLNAMRLCWISKLNRYDGWDVFKGINWDDKESMKAICHTMCKIESGSSISNATLEAAWKKYKGG